MLHTRTQEIRGGKTFAGLQSGRPRVLRKDIDVITYEKRHSFDTFPRSTLRGRTIAARQRLIVCQRFASAMLLNEATTVPVKVKVP